VQSTAFFISYNHNIPIPRDKSTVLLPWSRARDWTEKREHQVQGACGKQQRSYFISSFIILARGNILFEELILALGVLLGVLLEWLVFDQTHVGTEISVSSTVGRGLTEASSSSWW
jgi:hypothetical protein